MPKCSICGEEIQFPFICSYCGKEFCPNHRLPESHDCPSLPKGAFWYHRQKAKEKAPKKKGALSFVKAEPIKLYGRRHSRFGWLLGIRIKSIFSLKVWFPLFLLLVVLVLLLEQNNPATFYRNVPELAKYLLYAFAGTIGLWSGYRVFLKCDVNPSSDRGIFGLRLLSGGMFVAGLVVMMFGFSLHFVDFLISGSWPIRPQASLAREMTSAYLIVLSFVLIVLSAYLIFKFERRSGVIVYRR